MEDASHVDKDSIKISEVLSENWVTFLMSVHCAKEFRCAKECRITVCRCSVERVSRDVKLIYPTWGNIATSATAVFCWTIMPDEVKSKMSALAEQQKVTCASNLHKSPFVVEEA